MGRVLEPEVMEGDDEAVAYDELDRRRGNIIFQGFAEAAVRMGITEGRVLDVGTGSGRVAIRLARLAPAFQIEAVDLSRSMLELAQTNASASSVTNVTFSVGNARELPFDDQSFDLVVSHQLLHQLADPLIVLQEIRRVAKRNGGILVRDIRRLPEPWMTMALQFWCAGYSPRLREQTCASFRAGLTAREFRQLVRESGIDRALVRTNWLTHQTIERRADPYRAPRSRAATEGIWRRVAKTPYA
jgi:ubiquinone/menaquinone biosynthesis C-methylase UbiE